MHILPKQAGGASWTLCHRILIHDAFVLLIDLVPGMPHSTCLAASCDTCQQAQDKQLCPLVLVLPNERFANTHKGGLRQVLRKTNSHFQKSCFCECRLR